MKTNRRSGIVKLLTLSGLLFFFSSSSHADFIYYKSGKHYSPSKIAIGIGFNNGHHYHRSKHYNYRRHNFKKHRYNYYNRPYRGYNNYRRNYCPSRY